MDLVHKQLLLLLFCTLSESILPHFPNSRVFKLILGKCDIATLALVWSKICKFLYLYWHCKFTTRIAGLIAYLTVGIINISWMNNNHVVIFFMNTTFLFNKVYYFLFTTVNWMFFSSKKKILTLHIKHFIFINVCFHMKTSEKSIVMWKVQMLFWLPPSQRYAEMQHRYDKQIWLFSTIILYMICIVSTEKNNVRHVISLNPD